MQKSTWQKTFKDSFFIVLGCAIFAVGLDVFEVPNGLAAGGITGLQRLLELLHYLLVLICQLVCKQSP